MKKFFKDILKQKIFIGYNIFIILSFFLFLNDEIKEEFLRTNTTYWLVYTPILVLVILWVGTYISYKKRN
jgi:hypothetical protein